MLSVLLRAVLKTRSAAATLITLLDPPAVPSRPVCGLSRRLFRPRHGPSRGFLLIRRAAWAVRRSGLWHMPCRGVRWGCSAGTLGCGPCSRPSPQSVGKYCQMAMSKSTSLLPLGNKWAKKNHAAKDGAIRGVPLPVTAWGSVAGLTRTPDRGRITRWRSGHERGTSSQAPRVESEERRPGKETTRGFKSLHLRRRDTSTGPKATGAAPCRIRKSRKGADPDEGNLRQGESCAFCSEGSPSESLESQKASGKYMEVENQERIRGSREARRASARRSAAAEASTSTALRK